MCRLCSGLPAYAVVFSRILLDCSGVANMPHYYPSCLKFAFFDLS
jgi:hypothetical protein